MSTRVVIVDDVPDARLLVRATLRRTAAEVVGEAHDGGSAVEVVTATRPDVVVLDLGLPDVAGTELIPRLRAAVPDCRIVLFTGRDLDEDVPAVDGYVRKDHDVRRLAALVGELGDTARAASTRLPAEPASAALARAFVQRSCEAWACGSVADDAELVVTELVTNAIRHAGSAPEVRLVRGGDALRIEVRDVGSGSPRPRLAGDDEEGGRGLLLVAALSTAWGVDGERHGAGKVVWAELPYAGALAAS